jgi:haloalkane dehalogenase
LLHDFDLFDVTLVLHDWGGPIGLTLALTEPERVRRIVILDTAIDPREAWMSDAWVRMRERVEQTDDPPIAELMRSACFSDPGAEVLAAYEAPFPTAASKAGARGLAMSVPDGEHPSVAGVVDGFCDALRGTPTPMLILWAAHDPFLTLTSGRRLASRLGRRIDHVIPEAGNVLQEDQGAMIGNLIAEWLGCP